MIHAAAAFDVLVDGGDFPTRGVHDGVAIFREHAREVIHEAAAGDVRETFHDAGGQRGEEGLVVFVNAQQFVAERAGDAFELGGKFEAHLLEEDFAGEGVAVGVEAARCEAEDDVAGADARAVNHARAIHDADDGADEVILAGLIHAGHLRCFAADDGALRGFAGF